MPNTAQAQALSPDFNRLWAANLAAQSAEQLSLAATPIVAVLALGAGAGEVGLLAAAQTLPFLLLAIPLGLWADRHSRRSLMVAAELLRAVSLLGLLAGAVSGTLSLGLLAVLGFLGATGTVAFSVAAPALVPSIVAPDALVKANGRLEVARSLAFAAGPALAGAVVGAAGASAAFVLAAVLSVAAALWLWRLREPHRAHAPARHPMVELHEGLRFAWHHPLLRPIVTGAMVRNTSWFVLQAAYVPYAIRALGLDAQGVGLTLGCYGAGMVVGALLAGRHVIPNMRYGTAVILGPVVSVLAAACMVASLVWPHAAWAVLSFSLFGVGPIIWTITTTALRQRLTPLPLLGWVSAVLLTVNAGARPVGAALGAAVGAVWGEAACLCLALAGFVLQATMITRSPLRRLQQLPPQAAPTS